jgi:hypothetical protein
LVTGQIAFECKPNDSGAGWFCNCFTNGDAANLDVSAASGWDVCAIAAEQCPALVQPMFLEPFERPLPGLPD